MIIFETESKELFIRALRETLDKYFPDAGRLRVVYKGAMRDEINRVTEYMVVIVDEEYFSALVINIHRNEETGLLFYVYTAITE